jgi:hypothetical protein
VSGFFAVVEDRDRKGVIVLGRRPGHQSLDDFHVCVEIRTAEYKTANVAISRNNAQHPVPVPGIGVLVNQNGADLWCTFVVTIEGDSVALLEEL